MNDHAKGILFTILGVLFLSPDAVLVRLANLDLWPLLFWRSLFVAVGFFVLTVAIERKHTWPAYREIDRLGVLLICCYALSATCFYASLSLTSAASALIMMATAPVFSALYSRFFLREKIQLGTVFAIIGCLMGIGLIAGGDAGSHSLWGDLFGLANAVLWGAVITIMRAAPKRNWTPAFSLSNLLAAIPAALLAPTLVVPSGSIPFLLAIGFLVYPVSFAFLQLALRYVSAPEIALLLQLETVLGPLMVWWIVGEVPGPHVIFGGVIVITVLVLNSIAGLKKSDRTGDCSKGRTL